MERKVGKVKTKEQIEETISNIEQTFKVSSSKATKEWKAKLEILKWVLED